MNAPTRPSTLRVLAPLFLLGMLVSALLVGTGCNPPPATGVLSAPSKHTLTRSYKASPFTEAALKDDWRVTSGTWTVENGRLVGQQFEDDMPELGRDAVGTEDLPFAFIWLDKPLPHELRISFKAQGLKDPNDINIIFCGDGEDLSGYDLVFGGFGNFKHQLGWYTEDHEFSSREGLEKVKPGSLNMRTYEIEVERTELGGIKVWLDGVLEMEDDDDPKIADDDKRYFAFYTWDNKVEFWDLEIQDLSANAGAAAMNGNGNGNHSASSDVE